MIKVLADKVLQFDRGEKTSEGKLIVEKTKIGFCSLPDWVGETEYYQLAVKEGSIKPISSDTSVSDQQKIADLEKQVAELKLQQQKAAEKPLTSADLEEAPKVKQSSKTAAEKAAEKAKAAAAASEAAKEQ